MAAFLVVVLVVVVVVVVAAVVAIALAAAAIINRKDALILCVRIAVGPHTMDLTGKIPDFTSVPNGLLGQHDV